MSKVKTYDVLPQSFHVQKLLDAAIEAARDLPNGKVKTKLESAISAFSEVVSVTTWAVEDIDKPGVTQEQKKEVLGILADRYKVTDQDWIQLQNAVESVVSV